MNQNNEISKLEKARIYENKMIPKIGNEVRPKFHVSSPVGWMNDPNGFSEYKGDIHLFFQYYPYATKWGAMHWGHMITRDYVKWELQPVALAPDQEYDNFGCFSGSAIEWKGKHVLAYTGVQRIENKEGAKNYQTQCIAIGDGVHYKKIGTNPVIDAKLIPKDGSKLDFRDPKIWEENGIVYMVVGNRTEDTSGQILLYKTIDLENWEFVSVLDKCNNRYGKMWECPDFFELNGYKVLILSPQEMQADKNNIHAGDGTLSMIGLFDENKKIFQEHVIMPVDIGFDFYAPQTMLGTDGRRIMIAWMQSWCDKWFDDVEGFCGMMSFPRELSIVNEILYQLPVKEIECYYKNQIVLDTFLKEEWTEFESLKGRIMNLHISLDTELSYIYELRLAANERYYTRISIDSRRNVLIFDRSYAGFRKDAVHIREVELDKNCEKYNLQILMDKYSIELFIQGGRQAFTAIIKTPIDVDGVYMRANKDIKIGIVKNDIVID